MKDAEFEDEFDENFDEDFGLEEKKQEVADDKKNEEDEVVETEDYADEKVGEDEKVDDNVKQKKKGVKKKPRKKRGRKKKRKIKKVTDIPLGHFTTNDVCKEKNTIVEESSDTHLSRTNVILAQALGQAEASLLKTQAKELSDLRKKIKLVLESE